MNTYSQNKEDIFIARYFSNVKGTLLSIGENDGFTFSNARLLIEKGWGAHLVEPSSVYGHLRNLYEDWKDVHCHKLAIGEETGSAVLYESGSHVPNGADKALVSSLNINETARWAKSGVSFEPVEVPVFTFAAFWELTDFSKFDFITIDVEGLEWCILSQLDLNVLNCKCLIIEWNGHLNLLEIFTHYCAEFGLNLVVKNAENLIFTK